jgi:signal transduction histidine kinase
MRTKHTILVVDDEPDVVRSVKDLLRLDYNVIGATSAAEAEQIMQNQAVQVIMTDQRMPGVSGVEFLHRMRGEHPDAVRLLFTGYADIHAVIDAINQGNVYRYIAKPWDPDELQAIIREACERYDLLVERKCMLAELERKNKALEQANAALQQSGELKSAFIQVASHELRTPLTILLGLSRLAKMEANEPEELQPLLDRIDQSVQRMGRLVHQIVTQLMAQNFDNNLERQPVDLARIVQQAVDDVRPFIALRRQTLKLDLPDSMPEISVDPGKIRDCIDHLLLNAIKFTADGGEVSVGMRRGDDTLQIIITDTGCGIDQQCMQRLFEPFFTGFDVSHHSSGHFEHGRKGLGLGLSVVKSFIEMHGGRIDVTSAVNKGSTFTITLPQRSSVAAEARA